MDLLSIFHNGLKPDRKNILDKAVGGIMMVVDEKQATIVINALTSTNYMLELKALNKRGVLFNVRFSKNYGQE